MQTQNSTCNLKLHIGGLFMMMQKKKKSSISLFMTKYHIFARVDTAVQ